jgi:hypothetical protein
MRRESCKQLGCPSWKHPHKVRFIYRKSMERRISLGALLYNAAQLMPNRCPDLFLNSAAPPPPLPPPTTTTTTTSGCIAIICAPYTVYDRP